MNAWSSSKVSGKFCQTNSGGLLLQFSDQNLYKMQASHPTSAEDLFSIGLDSGDKMTLVLLPKLLAIFLYLAVSILFLSCSHIFRLEEGGVLTDCSIQTQEPDETLDFDFSSAEVLNKIIMKVR